MNRLFIMLSTYLLIINCYSQSIDCESFNPVDFIDEINEDELNEQDINIIEDAIQELKDYPIDINNATKKDIERLFFLDNNQIESIMYYLFLYAPIKSIYELLYIEGIDRNLFYKIIPYVYISDYKQSDDRVINNKLKRINTSIVTSFKSNLNNKEGYVEKYDSLGNINSNKSYVFNRLYNSTRINIERKKDFRLGLTIEKDPGEKWGDFISGYLWLMPERFIKNIIIGNYKSRMGLGLLMNTGFSMGKGFYSSSNLSRLPSFSPHSSVDEYNFLQGLIVETGFSKMLLTMLISYKRLDGITDENTITSIKKDGLHNKIADLEKINKVSLLTEGFSLTYNGDVYKCGINMIRNLFNNDFLPSVKPYNIYYFRGQQQLLFSLYNKITKPGFDFSSEVAICQNEKKYFEKRYSFSTVNSATFTFSGKTGISFIQRFYGNEFNSFWGKSYSESSNLQNEQGYSFFCYFPFYNDVLIKTGVDYFIFPQIKYGIDKPSSGYDIFFKMENRIVKNIKLNFSYRFKHKNSNGKDYNQDTFYISTPYVDSLKFIPHNVIAANKHQGYVSFDGKSGDINFICITGGNIIKKGNEEPPTYGYYISNSIIYKPKNSAISGNFSFTIFSTDDYSSRVYITERGMPYSLGFSSLYGDGIKSSINIKYDIFKGLTIWLKYSNVHYFDLDKIGTGLETIYGRNRSDVCALLKYKF